jgi:hypothetical protein
VNEMQLQGIWQQLGGSLTKLMQPPEDYLVRVQAMTLAVEALPHSPNSGVSALAGEIYDFLMARPITNSS